MIDDMKLGMSKEDFILKYNSSSIYKTHYNILNFPKNN